MKLMKKFLLSLLVISSLSAIAEDQPPFPDPKPLPPTRFGTWTLQVYKYASTYQNGQWNVDVQVICQGEKPLAVFDVRGRDNYYIDTPEEAIFNCPTEIDGQKTDLTIASMVYIDDESEKSFSTYQWVKDFNLPPEVHQKLSLSGKAATKDLGLSNLILSQDNFAFLFSCQESQPIVGVSTHQIKLLQSEECPKEGEVMINYGFRAELNDPEAAR